jgi:hypothetical protein
MAEARLARLGHDILPGHSGAYIREEEGKAMTALIGIRREDKSEWERRVPLTPEDAAALQREHGIQVIVQTSPIRAFSDKEFEEAGIDVQEDLSPCAVIFGIKEMPEAFFEPDKAYVFFAHVIKGQPYNMPMLKRMLDLGCTLIDYERVVDEQQRRLIFFGWHAHLSRPGRGPGSPQASAGPDRNRRVAAPGHTSDHRRGRLWQRFAGSPGDA